MAYLNSTIIAPVDRDLFDAAWAEEITFAVNSHLTEAAAAEAEASPLGKLVASAILTADSSGFTTTPTEIGTLSVPHTTGYTYEIEVGGQLASTGTDIYECMLYLTVVGGTQLVARRMESTTGDGAYPNIIRLRYRFLAGSTGTTVFKLGARRNSGAGTVRREAGSDHPQLFLARIVGVP